MISSPGPYQAYHGLLYQIAERVIEAVRSTGVPPGLRLEIHPRVRYDIYSDPSFPYYGPPFTFPATPEGLLERATGVPVKVTPDLPDGCWQLAIVTEVVLASGGGEPLRVVPREEP